MSVDVTVCPHCGADHGESIFFFCQTCEKEINFKTGYRGPMIQVPKHFRAANEGGYTMSDIRRENDEGFRVRESRGY